MSGPVQLVRGQHAIGASLVLVLACVGVGIVCAVASMQDVANREPDAYQEFVDTDGDRSTGYGISGIGADHVRHSQEPQARSAVYGVPGRGGWFSYVVPVHVEGYVEGRLTCSCDTTCTVMVGFDWNGNGHLDLYDFAKFQELYRGDSE